MNSLRNSSARSLYIQFPQGRISCFIYSPKKIPLRLICTHQIDRAQYYHPFCSMCTFISSFSIPYFTDFNPTVRIPISKRNLIPASHNSPLSITFPISTTWNLLCITRDTVARKIYLILFYCSKVIGMWKMVRRSNRVKYFSALLHISMACETFFVAGPFTPSW